MASSYNRDGGCVVYHSLFRFSIAMVIMVIVGALTKHACHYIGYTHFHQVWVVVELHHR